VDSKSGLRKSPQDSLIHLASKSILTGGGSKVSDMEQQQTYDEVQVRKLMLDFYSSELTTHSRALKRQLPKLLFS
jgi:hypothetical protein